MTAKPTRRQAICRTALAIAGSLASISVPDSASAQAWPSRTVTGVAPFAAGSASDVVARVVFDQLSRQIGQPIVVENRPGAGGTTGANVVAKSRPDGHTILATGALAAAHAIYRALPYATLRDFTPVIPLGSQPLVLVTTPAKGFKTLGDLIAAARAKPDKLQFRVCGCWLSHAFCGRATPRQRRGRISAYPVPRTDSRRHRAAGGTDRLHVRAGCGGSVADQRRQGRRIGRQRLNTRNHAAAGADHGGSGLCRRGL